MNCVTFCVQHLDWICTVIVDCVISVIIGSLADVPFHKIASGLWGGALRDDTICGRSWVSWTIWSDLVASWAAERTQLKVENGYHKCWWSLACCLPFLWRNSSAQNVVDVFDHRFLSHQEQGLWHHCFQYYQYTRSSIVIKILNFIWYILLCIRKQILWNKVPVRLQSMPFAQNDKFIVEKRFQRTLFGV